MATATVTATGNRHYRSVDHPQKLIHSFLSYTTSVTSLRHFVYKVIFCSPPLTFTMTSLGQFVYMTTATATATRHRHYWSVDHPQKVIHSLLSYTTSVTSLGHFVYKVIFCSPPLTFIVTSCGHFVYTSTQTTERGHQDHFRATSGPLPRMVILIGHLGPSLVSTGHLGTGHYWSFGHWSLTGQHWSFGHWSLTGQHWSFGHWSLQVTTGHSPVRMTPVMSLPYPPDPYLLGARSTYYTTSVCSQC
ncbi:hypothetical protein PoB_000155000 [Plakobranchus ocellatus]|uniref:Uncharacterized protein n=1 Tax=Plakobranchus ocellatus TaxID=259542 RepID=A0AAV3XWP2_9GAST|nr:hypothetical protein PoB_000155000 [Plakobranchus ocellatus]